MFWIFLLVIGSAVVLAKLGAYSIKLSKKAQGNTSRGDDDEYSSNHGLTLYTGTFRVEEFRLPVMRGQISFANKATIAPQALALSLAMSYGNGGAAKALPVSVSAMLRERYGRPEGFDGFSFYAPEAPRDASGQAAALRPPPAPRQGLPPRLRQATTLSACP